MPIQPRGSVRSLEGMIEAGLLTQARHTLITLQAQEDRLQHLYDLFPNASIETLQQGLNWLESQQSLAESFQSREAFPSVADLPLSPYDRGKGRYAYRIDVDIKGLGALRSGGERRADLDRYLVHHSETLLSPDEVERVVSQYVYDQLEAEFTRYRADVDIFAVLSMEYHIIAISRSE